MKISAEHNLSDEDLVKALAALAAESGIEEELQKAIKTRAAKAVDDTPKEPRHPALRHLYRLFLEQFEKANRDIERYAKEILAE